MKFLTDLFKKLHSPLRGGVNKTKNPFFLPKQRAANFQMYKGWTKRFALMHRELILHIKNWNYKAICITLGKGNYNDVGTPLDFRQKSDAKVQKLTSKILRCKNIRFWPEHWTSETPCCENVVSMLS